MHGTKGGCVRIMYMGCYTDGGGRVVTSLKEGCVMSLPSSLPTNAKANSALLSNHRVVNTMNLG